MRIADSSLTCFAPGNFLLGGKALNRDDIFQFGLNTVAGCHHAYNVTPAGIAPERQFACNCNLTSVDWAWQSSDTITEFPSINASAQWNSDALWAIDSDYYLRPGLITLFSKLLIVETMESYFYAYRLTGNTTYQDWAWEAFEHIVAATKAPFGFSSITDVMSSDGGSKTNQQQSFFLAETLKYAYLIFDDPERISLDEWVLNTEAHPLRRGPQFSNVSSA